MSSKAKKTKQKVMNHNRAVVRQFAEWINVCSFGVRIKVAFRIIRGRL